MKLTTSSIMAGFFAIFSTTAFTQQDTLMLTEQYRPQLHFTPKANWMNDPNGMVYYDSTYHLFYQYYPDSTVWGPMHWGHATSRDLFHWKHEPVAIYPDSLGYIFSGSAVFDKQNTSGFGTGKNPPLVAIYTSHDPIGERNNSNTFQNQSISYSLDSGKTWLRYQGNPVLKNPGIRDFRDPKVSWYQPAKKWIMTLATQDRITFYSSKDLKNWSKESEFGKNIGAHGGVWECPDLFTLSWQGKQYYVLLVSINPGGPNGGSATQYFVGDFDGHHFNPADTLTRWIDYGPDNYAGVTWSNTGNRKLFLGWMSNWDYASVVPTKSWRSAMTIPRELRLEKIGNALLLASKPATEISQLASKPKVKTETTKSRTMVVTTSPGAGSSAIISFKTIKPDDIAIEFSNKKGEKVIVGFNNQKKLFYIDRTNSGITDFNKNFASRITAPRFSQQQALSFTLVADNTSIELFADNGLTVMTALFFPTEKFDTIKMISSGETIVKQIEYNTLESIYSK